MPSALLYATCIFIWGTTWYAIELQLGFVPIEYSIAYRFLLSGFILLCYMLASKKFQHVSGKTHFLMALKGALLYGLAYIFIYHAGAVLTSGVSAVLFSSVVLTNIFFAALFFKRPLSLSLLAGACATFLGIGLFFWPEVQQTHHSTQLFHGAGLILASVVATSLGNIASEFLSLRKISIIESNGYAMVYGGLFSVVVGLFLKRDIVFDVSFVYVGSLLYLSLLGSIVAFGCYMVLLRRLGSEKVALPLVTIPVISLIVSSFFEHYHGSVWSLAGLIFVLLGNVVALSPRCSSSSLRSG